MLPKAAIPRIKDVVETEWGSGLIRSWNAAGWIELAQRIGDKIATLVGARTGEVIVADSTSINLFKALSARRVRLRLGNARPHRGSLSERTNFPTDLYIADTFARDHGMELVLVDQPEIAVASRRSRGDPDADPRQLPHRPHARMRE